MRLRASAQRNELKSSVIINRHVFASSGSLVRLSFHGLLCANVTIRWAIDNSINKQATIPTITIPEEQMTLVPDDFCRFYFLPHLDNSVCIKII